MAQDFSEQRFDLMQRIDEQKEQEKNEKAKKAQQERERHKTKMEEAKKNQMLKILQGSLIAKEDKMRYLKLAEQKRQLEDEERLEKAEQIRE